jgi:hypothetical protein
MGSLAASRYAASLASVTARLPTPIKHQANVSLTDALSTADKLGGVPGTLLRVGAEHAFIDGIQPAVTVGALLAAMAAVIVFRSLPRQAAHCTAAHGPVEAMEASAELGLAGIEPAFDD